MNPENNSSPVFVLSCARSGSTLLRYILDSHPVFCCPPELHLVELAEKLFQIYKITSGFGHAASVGNTKKIVAKKIRRNIEEIMREYSEQLEKSIWCEKSIRTIDGVDLIKMAFPEARYICLHRHCLDQVSSALETLDKYPTGIKYDFEHFLRQGTGNPTNALIDYWQAKTTAIFKFERENPEQCIRLRYEDIVSDYKVQLKELFDFLGADWEEGMLDSIFTTSREKGPGDHKILQTNKIHTSSVGRGDEIDVRSITPDRIETANHLLTELDYNTIDR